MALAAAAAAPECTAAATDVISDFPTDAFVEILLRLPPSSRRRFRLVSRYWRATVDGRTPRMGPPMVLACFMGTQSASACVVEDLATGRCREVWGANAGAEGWLDRTVVGTCNGLLCLCDNRRPGGRVSVVNPSTGEKLALPPLPASCGFAASLGGRRGKAYGFACHPTTGQYKVVHLPCHAWSGGGGGGFSAVQVFTLGGSGGGGEAWRDAPVPGGSCRLDAGLVGVGGAMHWLTERAERVVAFDLARERVAPAATPLPVRAGPGTGYDCRLAEVEGRLGLAVSADKPVPARTDVWVLGDDGSGWSRRYCVQVQQGVEQRLAGPHFAHGDHVLTVDSEYMHRSVFAHRMRGGAGRLPGEVRSLRIRDQGTVVAHCKNGAFYLRTFAYVETTEPLSAYKLDHRRRK